MRLLSKIREKNIIYFGHFLFISGLFFVSLLCNPLLLFTSTLVLTIGGILIVPSRQTLLANIIPDHSRSKYLSVFHLHARFGNMFGSLGIVLGAYVSSQLMSGMFVILGLLSLLFLRLVQNRNMSDSINIVSQ